MIDLGFAIEPREEDELPEVVLGSLRLSRVDVERPLMVAAEPGDWVLGSLGVVHGTGATEEGGEGGVTRAATMSGPRPDASGGNNDEED